VRPGGGGNEDFGGDSHQPCFVFLAFLTHALLNARTKLVPEMLLWIIYKVLTRGNCWKYVKIAVFL
jgi:hypothetical protein